MKEQAAAGFEPANNGFANRRLKDTTIDNTKTCETSKEQLTPQLTPKSQKHSKIDTLKLPSDLTEVITVWPDLPDNIKAAIKALIRTA